MKNNSFSLLVGVGRRDEDDEAMEISSQDADWLRRALKSFDICDNIITLRDSEAERQKIEDGIRTLAQECKKNGQADLVIIYFSGHGCKIGDDYYLICRDTKNKTIDETGLRGSEFVNALREIPCEKMLVLLDCCHSGGIGYDKQIIPFNEKELLPIKNRVILTACQNSEYSYLSKPISLFTYAVIEGLAGAFLPGDDVNVELLEFAMSVRERVATASETVLKLSKPQQPKLNVFKSTTNFILALHPNGKPKEIRLLRDTHIQPITNPDEDAEETLPKKLTHENSKKEIDMNMKREHDYKERAKFEVKDNRIIFKGDITNSRLALASGNKNNVEQTNVDFKVENLTINQIGKSANDNLKDKRLKELKNYVLENAINRLKSTDERDRTNYENIISKYNEEIAKLENTTDN